MCWIKSKNLFSYLIGDGSKDKNNKRHKKSVP